VPDAGAPTEFANISVPAAPPLGKPDGKVKVYGMPPSANSVGPIMLAMDAGVGGIEFLDLTKGDQNKPEFLAMNPFHHIPTLSDGDFAIGEGGACLRYIAAKYKPAYYPPADATARGMIDFALESFCSEVFPKIKDVFYPVFGFGDAPADQAVANTETAEVLDTWMKHFVKGKFTLGDKLSIADFKAAPFLFCVMQPVVESKSGFKLSDAGKKYVQDFMEAVDASKFMKEAGGFAIVEYAASKA